MVTSATFRLADATGEGLITDHDLLREAAFVDGSWVCITGPAQRVNDPATGALVGRVPDLGAAGANQAIAAAERAFSAWRGLLAKDRAALLRHWSALMLEARDDLARIITLEQGKPLTDARDEIDYAASFLDWFAEEAVRLNGEILPTHLPGRRLLVQRDPIGVAACITPWNFPSAMITRKAGAAMAAGCPMIVKPAQETPFSALALAVLAERAGIPAGVFQVITGDAKKIGQVLTRSEVVRALSFTGSTHVGQLLLAQSADTVKKVSLELGGHAPFLVFDDADIDKAVADAVVAKFQTTGQDCLAANRILVQRPLYETFIERFTVRSAALSVGNGFDDGVDLGPLMNRAAVDKCAQHVADAVAKGARLTTGGKPHKLGGLFVEPAVLADVTPAMLIFREETFGPVAAIMPFDAEDDAVRVSNQTPYGLAAYVYTRDLARAFRLSERLDYGMVAVNTPKFTGAQVPFGGVKQSGLGREGSCHGIDEYVELKYLCLATG